MPKRKPSNHKRLAEQQPISKIADEQTAPNNEDRPSRAAFVIVIRRAATAS